ncbi:MAG: CPBP family intramembrane metalloprotease [Acidimicrobiia bacterium]|nr:CPBP family intramembrane metalloprotease [Acidimicrobiia bacterium]MYF83304.1 CPBP family intramembrane metalloprotease [Acidimicrobiia bacterium]
MRGMGRPGDGLSEAVVVVSLTGLAIVLPFARSAGTLVAGGIAAVLLATIAMARKMPAGSSIGLLLVAFLLLGITGLRPKRLLFGLAVVAYVVAAARVPWLREVAPWRRVWSCNLRQGAVGAAVGLGAGLVLWAWYDGRPEQLADIVEITRDWSIWTLASVGVLAAVVNAVVEEAVYRGIVQDSLERVLRPGVTALVMQAAVFAALHFPSGILQGLAGVGLAFLYGLMLGLLRRRSGGLAVPVIAHTVTDLVIVGAVLAQFAA